jgi:RTX calcium-binding nonapeptide repeat (4 copies)
MRTIMVLTALLLLVPAAAEARMLKGDASSEVLRGGPRADVIKGKGGNDRLVGRGGNDRLYGGRGADRFSCGPGRDVIYADMSDVKRGRIAADCEILRGIDLDVTDDEPAAAPPAADRQPGCRYVTKPVLVLRGGEYVFEQQVVVDCPVGTPPAAPGNPPATPASRWEPILPAYWFQYEDFPALYRFRADHTGVRTTYPTGNLSFGTPYGFSWKLAGDVVTLTFPSGYVDQVTLAAYDNGRDFLTRTSSSTGVGAWYGCRSGQIPDIIAFALCA